MSVNKDASVEWNSAFNTYFDEWSNLVLIATVNFSHEKHLYKACLYFYVY